MLIWFNLTAILFLTYRASEGVSFRKGSSALMASISSSIIGLTVPSSHESIHPSGAHTSDGGSYEVEQQTHAVVYGSLLLLDQNSSALASAPTRSGRSSKPQNANNQCLHCYPSNGPRATHHRERRVTWQRAHGGCHDELSLIHISEPTRPY